MTKIPEGSGEFKIAMPIAKSYEKTTDGETRMYIAGIASGTQIDHDSERMSETAIQAFKKAIEEGVVLPNGKWSLVPLRSGHRKEWDDVLGYITKADVDDDHNLWIEAELDDASSVARDLFTKLHRGDRPGRPLQLGFSVGGRIKKATREWNAETKKSVRVIEDVSLNEVSVVGSPAYPPSYVDLLNKSVNWDDIPVPQQEVTQEYIMKEQQKQDDAVAKAEGTEEVKVEETKTEEVPAGTTEEVKKEVATEEKPVETVEEGVTTKAQGIPEGVTAITEETKTEGTEQSTEKSVYFSEDASSVSELIQKLEAAIEDARKQLSSVKEASTTEKPAEKVEKADTQVVEKSEATLEDRIVAALEAGFSKFKTEHLDPLVTDMQAVKSTVEEISEQPLDKSVAVRGDKDKVEKEVDPVEEFRKRVSDPNRANGRVSPIGIAIRQSLNG